MTSDHAQDDDGFLDELAEHYAQEWAAIVADERLWPVLRGRLVRQLLTADPKPSDEVARALWGLLDGD